MNARQSDHQVVRTARREVGFLMYDPDRDRWWRSGMRDTVWEQVPHTTVMGAIHQALNPDRPPELQEGKAKHLLALLELMKAQCTDRGFLDRVATGGIKTKPTTTTGDPHLDAILAEV